MAEQNDRIALAIFFAYEGSKFSGLERNKGDDSIEHFLFKAIAGQYPAGTPVSMTHISRAASTNEGEHAAKQVISLYISNVTQIPTVQGVNAQLPESIRVFKIEEVGQDFSARRTCEARTIEFLIPTYAFMQPPEATLYCNPEDELPDNVVPGEMPQGGLFKTLKKSHSLARRGTFKRPTEIPEEFQQAAPAISPVSPVSPPSPPPERKSGMFSCFSGMFSNSGDGSERLKQSLDATLVRSKSKKSAQPEGFSGTLGRTLSRSTRTFQDVLDQDIKEREENEGPTEMYEPLNIPAPTADELMDLVQFRLGQQVYERIVFALALFNGTHNFHNYIPGSVQDDQRCFVRVFNIEAAPLEIHNGMEWLRVKVQARSFGRDQVRRMMAMLIMVIRTNTPRSVIANSFGYNKIDLPEAPAQFLILDQVHYNNYNADAAMNNVTPVSFGDIVGIKEFKQSLLETVFAKERQDFVYEKWIRELDNYSFMYTHFLNERGLITKPKNYPLENL